MFKSGQLLQDRYQLQQPLGRSPQARQTWLATDLATDLHELVVIKLLVFTEMQWQDLKLFEREAQVLQNLDHPRIPRYRDYFLVEQQPQSQLCWWGLVQDYVPGRSLQELLEQGTRWSEQEVRQIAEDVLQILIYLHSLSPLVLHRDIKPSNLIYHAHAQQVWLVDFGAVQDQIAVTGVSFTVVGTVGYTPLEQFWGRAIPASDLYALGATCIHLLTGVAPCDLPQRNLRIHFRDRINFRSNFVDWIEKLTEPALEKRFASVHEACESLGRETNYKFPPIDERIQTVCPSIVIKQNSPQVLKIEEICAPSSKTVSNQISSEFYFIWGLMFCMLLLLLPVIGAAVFALIFLFTLIWLVWFVIALWEVRNADPENTHAICFDGASDRFKITTRVEFTKYRELGVISAIRYLSIISPQADSNQNNPRTGWVVKIRADRNYVVNWGLTEEECIWLVNEIQTWLNAKK